MLRPGLFLRREGPGSEPGNSLVCPDGLDFSPPRSSPSRPVRRPMRRRRQPTAQRAGVAAVGTVLKPVDLGQRTAEHAALQLTRP